MNIFTKYLLRLFTLFIITTIIWGVFFGLTMTIHTGETGTTDFVMRIIVGIVWGGISSFIFTLIIGTWDYLARRRLLKRYGHLSYGVIHKREIFLSGTIEEMMDRSISVLRMIKGMKKILPDYTSNKIIGIRRVTWIHIGQKIELKLATEDKGKIRISIISRSRLGDPILDFGDNFELVELFYSRITATQNNRKV